MRQRLLVIGNGMAGMQMVESLLQRAPMRNAINTPGQPAGNGQTAKA
jgi:nitrite reductase (NADH) large subunit